MGTETAVVNVKSLLETVIGTLNDEPEATLRVVAVTGTSVVRVVWLPVNVTGTDTTVGCVSGGLGVDSVIGALAVKVVSLFEMTTGTDTIDGAA